MNPMSRNFVAALKRYVARHKLALVQFRQGQRKDDVMAEHLRQFGKEEGVLFVGKAQEKTKVFRAEKSRSPTTGKLSASTRKARFRRSIARNLPMKKGRAQTMTHDYKRNGTTTLFAALDVKTGKVIGECLPRHRAKEFIRFLKPKPFKWTAKANIILEKNARGRRALEEALSAGSK
jgi:hypothetical protein